VSNLVALLNPMTSIPVAIGSSVPAWPTFRVPAIFRVRDTTSWEVQPAGLSTSMSPELSAAMRILFLIWVFVAGVGRGFALCGEFGITCFGGAHCFFKLRAGFWHGIWDEFQSWTQSDVEAMPHFATQQCAVFFHGLVGLGHGFVVPKDRVVHGCLLQIVGDACFGDGHVVDAIIFDGFV